MSLRLPIHTITACLLALAAPHPGYALGGERYVDFSPRPGAFPLVQGAAAPLVVDAQDWPGVLRATRDLQALSLIHI